VFIAVFIHIYFSLLGLDIFLGISIHATLFLFSLTEMFVICTKSERFKKFFSFKYPSRTNFY